ASPPGTGSFSSSSRSSCFLDWFQSHTMCARPTMRRGQALGSGAWVPSIARFPLLVPPRQFTVSRPRNNGSHPGSSMCSTLAASEQSIGVTQSPLLCRNHVQKPLLHADRNLAEEVDRLA